MDKQPKRPDPRRFSARGETGNVNRFTPSPSDLRNARRQTIADRSSDKFREDSLRRSRIRVNQYKIKKKRNDRMKNFLIRAALSLTLALLVFGLIVIVFFSIYNRTETDAPDSLRLLLSGTDDTSTRGKRVDVSRYYRNGTYYLNVTLLAETYSFTTTGDKYALRYILDTATGDNLLVRPGSRMVSVNGTEVFLAAPCVRDEEGVWLPLSFFNEYMSGLRIGFSDKPEWADNLQVSRVLLEGEGSKKVFFPISLKTSSPRACDPLPPEQGPVD